MSNILESSQTGPGRRSDLDWLRILGMFTVFVVHTAQVFSPWQYWHIQDGQRNVWFGQVNLFAWPWVMPLFMLLAGVGAFISLGHRNPADYVRVRAVRLALPFFIGSFLLIPPQLYVERLAEGRFEGSYIRFYPRFFDCCYPEGNLAAGHLWFIGYLFVFAIVSLPIMLFLNGGRGRRWLAHLGAACRRPGGVLWLIAPVAISQIALRGRFPQTHMLINDWANNAILFITYLYGFMFAADRDLRAAVEEQWLQAALPAIVASGWLGWYAATTDVAGILPIPWTLDYVLFWALFSVASWSWIVLFAGVAQHLLRRPRPAAHYASDAVYPFYILHQTVIVLIAYHVVQWELGVVPKFAVLFVLSFAVTTGLTELSRRWKPARLALGMRDPVPLRTRPK